MRADIRTPPPALADPTSPGRRLRYNTFSDDLAPQSWTTARAEDATLALFLNGRRATVARVPIAPPQVTVFRQASSH